MTAAKKRINQIAAMMIVAFILAGCAAEPVSDPPPLGIDIQDLEETRTVETADEINASDGVVGTAGKKTVARPVAEPLPTTPENPTLIKPPALTPEPTGTSQLSSVGAETPSSSEPNETATVSDAVMEPAETEADPLLVRMTIRDREGLPDIIADQPVEWEPGDTVLSLLIRMTRAQQIHLAFRGRGRTAYVEGINHLYEFDKGPASGWVYSVNGVFPNRSAGGWETAAGDKIVWWYTLDAGRDVGAMGR